ncbi:hypothetical protein [Caloramator sp. Dgby_cultured_2]|uniref:hypothetical protein n=1 Tax=Caloramator sp. Dgby_cultured_2 TaxID=3029174 RepID=UPI00237ED40D|nr:hypothetical protein [Caloramator sp. Dgby_cultured_2]WDU82351.1 hypothetical protein PWK10_11815 [Caloramator sp. Dgby_cultured_2]
MSVIEVDKLLAFAKLKYYALNNILWTLFYSGCGIPYFFSEKEREHINKISSDKDKELLENLMPLHCIYKEAKASFSEAPSSIVNPGKYIWDFNSFKKKLRKFTSFCNYFNDKPFKSTTYN